MLNKKYRTKRCIVTTVLLCLYFSIGVANNAVSQETTIDPSSPIVQAVLNRQKLIREKEFQLLWYGWTDITRKEGWADYGNFIEWFNKNPELRNISGARIKNINFITPNRAVVTLYYTSSAFQGFYLVQEGGTWKFSLVHIYIKKVKKDLEMLRSATMNYFADVKEFPSGLSQLIPIYIGSIPYDPFSDEDKGYLYISSEEGFALYSIGPDGQDDLGKIEYRPQNGIFSKGDIVAEK